MSADSESPTVDVESTGIEAPAETPQAPPQPSVPAAGSIVRYDGRFALVVEAGEASWRLYWLDHVTDPFPPR